MGNRARVYVDKDVYTASSVGNVMPVDKRPFYMNGIWRHVDTHIVPERNNSTNESNIKVVSGTWRPGEWAKNTINAEDIKAWYPTTAQPPNWVENLVICAMVDEFSLNLVNLNAIVELRYVVQFKDLRQAFRYPSATTGATAITFSTASAPASTSEADQLAAAGDFLQTPHLS